MIYVSMVSLICILTDITKVWSTTVIAQNAVGSLGLSLVNGRGNLWVFFSVPLPLPTRPLPMVRGAGFLRGTNFKNPTQPIPIPLVGYPWVFGYIEAGDIVVFNYVSQCESALTQCLPLLLTFDSVSHFYFTLTLYWPRLPTLTVCDLVISQVTVTPG
jgi:hypothetical protein